MWFGSVREGAREGSVRRLRLTRHRAPRTDTVHYLSLPFHRPTDSYTRFVYPTLHTWSVQNASE